ncbi:MAG: Imm10 family immunity protein [Actinoplanes sp.]
MSIEFVAHVVGVDDEDCLVAGIAERDDGTGRSLIFQAGVEPPDEQDVMLGLDTYCVVTETQGTAYGCVRELAVNGDRMHVVVSVDALNSLGLANADIQVRLAVQPESIDVLRTYLGRILTYGRSDAHPTVLRL